MRMNYKQFSRWFFLLRGFWVKTGYPVWIFMQVYGLGGTTQTLMKFLYKILKFHHSKTLINKDFT